MSNWTDICNLNDITPNTGVCALHNGEQVAIFRIQFNDEETVYAVNNYDPLSDANVISRGIVGTVGDDVVVASPIYKQHFKLTNGSCIEDDTAVLKTYAVRIESNKVQLAA